MSQHTRWKHTNREFYLHPDVDDVLICIFDDGGSCIWARCEDSWTLIAAREKSHIGSACKPEFGKLLNEAYTSLQAQKGLLED